jgi:ketosteroid isomerase-like protein
MPQENVETAVAAYRAMLDRDLPAFLTFLHEEVEWRQDERSVEPGTYHGHHGVLKFYEALYETFEDFAVVPERYFDAGDHVVAFLHISGSGQTSGIRIDNDVANVLTFRDGKIAVLEIYLDRSEALKAAGLSE